MTVADGLSPIRKATRLTMTSFILMQQQLSKSHFLSISSQRLWVGKNGVLTLAQAPPPNNPLQ